MAKQIVGKISEFNEEIETFANYTERLEHFLAVNSIEEKNKVSYFISIMGPALFTTLKNLLHPKGISDVNFKDIIKVLKDHFTPKCNVSYERFVFNKRIQKEGESISEYSCQLKKLAATCNFQSFLDEALRDRFLCGLRSTAIQSKLLAEGDSLTFTKALEISLLQESADKNVRSFNSHPEKFSQGEVNYVKPHHSSGQGKNKPKYVKAKSGQKLGPNSFNQAKQRCYRCGKPHDPKTCIYANSTCYSCNKKGHLASVCRISGNKYRPSNKINLCESDCESEPTDRQELELFTIALANNDKPGSFVVNVVVNEANLPMVIDTGACVSVMPVTVFDEKFRNGKTRPTLKESSIKLKTYTGEKINVLGEFQATVMVNARNGKPQQHRLPLVVIESSAANQPSLMGRNWLEVIQLDWTQVTSKNERTSDTVNRLQNGESVPCHNIELSLMEEIKAKYGPVFDQSPGEIKSKAVNIALKENAKPVFCKARSVPFALKDAVEKELDKLESSGGGHIPCYSI